MRLHPSSRRSAWRPGAAAAQIELIYELLDAHPHDTVATGVREG